MSPDELPILVIQVVSFIFGVFMTGGLIFDGINGLKFMSALSITITLTVAATLSCFALFSKIGWM